VGKVLQRLPRDITPVNLEELRRVKQSLVELESKADTLRRAPIPYPAWLSHALYRLAHPYPIPPGAPYPVLPGACLQAGACAVPRRPTQAVLELAVSGRHAVARRVAPAAFV